MRYFGPVFDRSIARKLTEKFGGFDSPTMGDLAATSVQYQGRRQRIISKETADAERWRYILLACGPGWVDAFKVYRSYLLNGAMAPYRNVSAQVAATGSGGAQFRSLDAGAIPVGNGEFVFRTVAALIDYKTLVTTFWKFNAGPTADGTLKSGTAEAVLTITTTRPGLDYSDYPETVGLFTGWLGTPKKQGFVTFSRIRARETTNIAGNLIVWDTRVVCTRAVGFSNWLAVELPAPVLGNYTRAGTPFMLCSKAGQISGLVAYADPTDQLHPSLFFYTSIDNGMTWAMTGVSEYVPASWLNASTTVELSHGAASGQWDVFVLQSGDVLRHQAGATGYSFIAAALPAARRRKVFHIGSGCFLCFSAIGDPGFINALAIHRSTDQGLTWTLLAGSGLSGVPVEFIGDVTVIEIYGDALQSGRCVVPRYLDSGTLYDLMESKNGGETWTKIVTLPNAEAPVVDPDDWPNFGYNLWRLVDAGDWDQLRSATPSALLLLGTDPSRPSSLVE